MLVHVRRKCWTQSKFRTGGFGSGEYYWEIINKNKIKMEGLSNIRFIYNFYHRIAIFLLIRKQYIFFSFDAFIFRISLQHWEKTIFLWLCDRCAGKMLAIIWSFTLFSLLKFKHNLTDLSAIFFFSCFTLFYGPPDPSLIKLRSSRTVLFLWIAISPINLTITQMLLIVWLK